MINCDGLSNGFSNIKLTLPSHKTHEICEKLIYLYHTQGSHLF